VLSGSLHSGSEGGQYTDSPSEILDTSGNSGMRCLFKAKEGVCPSTHKTLSFSMDRREGGTP
jgi:hypothetical protein